MKQQFAYRTPTDPNGIFCHECAIQRVQKANPSMTPEKVRSAVKPLSYHEFLKHKAHDRILCSNCGSAIIYEPEN